MGLILAGILVGALVLGLTSVYMSRSRKANGIDATALTILAVVCIIGGMVAGVAMPVSGYGEAQVVSTTELVSLRDKVVSEGRGGLFYVSVSGTNSYTYYTEAKLVTYVKYAKKSFWTFAVGAEQYEYVFYVPTGTIARDVSLS